MPLKNFILYFLPFLIAGILLLIVTRLYAARFAAEGKKPIVYSLLFSVCLSVILFALTYLSVYLHGNLFVLFWIMSLCSLLSGIIHWAITHKKFFSHAKESPKKLFWTALFFALSVVFFTVIGFAVLQYFVKDSNFLFYPILFCLLFFLVPFFIFHTIAAAGKIPSARFPTWHYPISSPPELPDEKEGERVFVIGFEIAKNAGDTQRTFFRAKAPEHMLLGDLYYHFINDYNELQSETPIQYMEHGTVHTWYFRTKPKWYGFSRILNAGKTVGNVGIRENSIIICERAGLLQDPDFKP